MDGRQLYLHNYRLFVPKQAVGANLVYFDLFNAAGSGVKLAISSIQPVVSGAVAVAATVGIDLFLTGTTDVGTGGTAATYNGTDTTACTVSNVNIGGERLSPLVTARITPTGGATAGRVISWGTVLPDETTSWYAKLIDFVNISSNPEDIVVPEGHGIRVVQGSVASLGNMGFNVSFGVI